MKAQGALRRRVGLTAYTFRVGQVLPGYTVVHVEDATLVSFGAFRRAVLIILEVGPE